ncbi:MAG TPA: choice-of-anchor A family protein, partial [Lachnospiraceae bacterium]|nr:choice-of-anchor A family protein [Lachnospiraceae bacterium]
MRMRKRWVKASIAMLALVAMLTESAYSAFATISTEYSSEESASQESAPAEESSGSSSTEETSTPAAESTSSETTSSSSTESTEVPVASSTEPAGSSSTEIPAAVQTPETSSSSTEIIPMSENEAGGTSEEEPAEEETAASVNCYEDRIEVTGKQDLTLYINTDQMNGTDKFSLALEGSALLQYDSLLAGELSKAESGIYYITGLNEEQFRVWVSAVSDGMSVQYSVREDGNPQITLISAPEEEIEKVLSISADGSRISGEGYEDITLSFEAPDLPDEDYFALHVDTAAEASYNGSKLVNGTISSLSNKTTSVRLSDLDNQAFTIYITGENVDAVDALCSVDSVENGAARMIVSLGEDAQKIQSMTASTDGITGSGYEKVELSMEYIEKVLEEAAEQSDSEEDADSEETEAEAQVFQYSLYIETEAENVSVNGQTLDNGKVDYTDSMESVIVDGLDEEAFHIYAVADDAEDTEEPTAISYSVESEESGTAKISFTYTSAEEDVKRVYEYEDSKVKIKVTLQNPEDLPDDAVLVATEIPAGTETYESLSEMITEQKKEEKGAFLSLGQAVYDIHFTLDGEEIEPENEVEVNIVYKSPALEDSSSNPSNEEASIYHAKENDGGDVVDVEKVAEDVEKSEDGGIAEATFTVEDFSSFVATLDADGKWSNSHGLTYELNKTTNAFTGTKYYNSDRVLGIAGNFHIVAFDDAHLQVHTNGNVLAKELYAGANFGTNNLTDELSYVQDYAEVNTSNMPSADHTLALGSDATVSFDGEAADATYFKVNGTKIDRPNNIIQDSDTSANPFIDLNAVKSSISSLSSDLASVADTGVTASFSDQNSRSITLNTPNGAGYYNMTASELNGYAGNKFDLKGFESGKNGSIIINVNCSGVSTVTMPQSSNVYVDGSMVSASETTEWSAGKVIWNFYNCSGATIYAQSVFGAIIAVDATLYVNKGNGTFIADTVYVTGETHRTDFTGITTPTSAKLNVHKTFDGTWPDAGFTFKIEAVTD